MAPIHFELNQLLLNQRRRTFGRDYTAPCLRGLTVEKKIGSGSFGEVMACTDNSTKEKLALKILDLDPVKKGTKRGSQTRRGSCAFMSAKDNADREMAQSEATLWEACGSHPNIVRLYQTHMTEDSVYFVMERCKYSLKDAFDAKGVAPERLKMYTFQMLQALEHVHSQSIIHRDIKPANYLIAGNGAIKLCDFGLSIRNDPSASSVIAGTPLYQAPEMLKRSKYGCAVDMWSQGVTLYVLTFRRYPYALINQDLGALANSIKSNSPKPSYSGADQLHPMLLQLVPVIEKLLEHSPAERATASACMQMEPLMQMRRQALPDTDLAWGSMSGNSACSSGERPPPKEKHAASYLSTQSTADTALGSNTASTGSRSTSCGASMVTSTIGDSETSGHAAADAEGDGLILAELDGLFNDVPEDASLMGARLSTSLQPATPGPGGLKTKRCGGASRGGLYHSNPL